MKIIFRLLVLSVAFLLKSNVSFSQLIVDSKNVNDDKNIQYIQLMYYEDQKSFKPVYLIDYGVIEAGTGPVKNQKISVDGVQIKDSMSPVLVLNALYKAGWEYMGDGLYIKVPLMENLVTYTFRRKKG